MAHARWEYLTERVDGKSPQGPVSQNDAAKMWAAKLNQLGQDGWELVAEHRYLGTANGDSFITYRGTFKRPAE